MPLVKTLNMISVTFQRAGYHRYDGAPQEVEYLRHVHRHLFKFKVSIEVFHNDRELEFHCFLNWLESCLPMQGAGGSIVLDGQSCEMMSDALAELINGRYPGRSIRIEVWEDGECGSYAEYQHEAA